MTRLLHVLPLPLRQLGHLALFALLLPATVARAAEGSLNTGVAVYRGAAATQVDVTMVRGITRSDQLPPHLLAVRKRLSRGAYVRFAQLRDLADHRDGNAAFQLANRLDLDARPDLAADIAHYYAIAAVTGSGGAIFGFIAALDRVDPGTTSPGRLEVLKNALLAYAIAGSSAATEALIRHHVSGTPFGPMQDELEALARREGAPGADAAALQLASEILQDKAATAGDLRRARGFLEAAGRGSSLRQRLIVQNLGPVVDTRLSEAVSLALLTLREGPR
ncbi:hypothetical protein CLG85_020970 [Yangia mangrovi]|uniref:Uncharacterized protein n=1 Tax=Alloyangia mangrovi TaxID=1779329 RepID=A0A2A3JNF8_9RHOB|nr:hypothetical protein [Alloyangia mangrovi]MCT4372641.1 hypothetical protein [Alloyangia mangrovi]